MAKLLFLMSDGFEDVEGIATIDVLTRGGNELTLASIMKRNEIVSKTGIKMYVNSLIEDINQDDYDGIVIPGGPGSFKIMPNCPVIFELIEKFANENKLVAAICAAPYLIGKLGLLKDKNYTVHPGFETQVIGGNYLREKGVVRDSNFITAKSMFYSIEFGLTIHEYFYGTQAKLDLEKSLQGEGR